MRAVWFGVCVALWAHCAIAQDTRATAPRITRLAEDSAQGFMWVGNSFFYYNNGMPAFVLRLLAGGPPAEFRPYRATMITMGGSGLDWHDLESYFKPGAVGRYSFDADNNVVFNTNDKLFDVAILMDCSQCPIHPTLGKIFPDIVKTDARIARAHGAEPVLFMSWAYADKPEMTAELAAAYTLAGNTNNALVIPAGLAFARIRTERPDIQLYQPDNRHPTVAGTYLAAATSLVTLYHRPAEENSYTAGLDPDVARVLRVAAWRTALAYFGPGFGDK